MPSRNERASAPAPPATSERIDDRYDVLEELGRGGMACVYRVRDVRTGQVVALKQLLRLDHEDKHASEIVRLFEREFHTLAQLAHPRVIEVYDYGIARNGAYYTMELLDGGDISQRSPLPWREACELIFDVCSSLALLHSRRLVHRDVGPRNVRCTHDGHAKLIDFGAMSAMGTNAQVVGTPPFVAPEAVHGSTLDGRSDLFALGATLYFALTGHLAYPARNFAQLTESWAVKPAAPSAFAPDVPPALDSLVMSMMSLEPALRPRSAFEVMQRLAGIAGVTREEPLSVSKAYLITPTLFARDEALAEFRKTLARAQHGRGRALLIAAPAGLGRTRMLDACVLEAKTTGCYVLRAAASGAAGQELAGMRGLAEQLLRSAPLLALEAARTAQLNALLLEQERAAPANDRQPILRSFTRSRQERSELARALVQWFFTASMQNPLLIAFDDIEGFDDASVAVLAALAQGVGDHALVLLTTTRQAPGASLSPALELLSSQCDPLALRALNLPETELLLGSVFGDVPNLTLLSTRINEVAAGKPREIMGIAQHLVDRDTIRYADGNWSLPEQLTAAELPTSALDAFHTRATQLSALARRLADAQALALGEEFTREDYALLEPQIDAQTLDAALTELVTQQALTSHDGLHYTLQHLWVTVLCDALDDSTRRARYRALAERSERAGKDSTATARLWLLCGEWQRGLDGLLEFLRRGAERLTLLERAGLTVTEAGRTLQLALQAALLPGRGARDAHDIRHSLVMLSVSADEDLYSEVAPAWRRQLERDSGLDDYRSLRDIEDANERLMRSLTIAAARYAAAPEHERVYPPDEAIRALVHYVLLSIAESARAFDMRLTLSLPELLEPFTPLSPLVAAIWQNSVALVEVSFRRHVERANELWLEVYERLGSITSSDQEFVPAVRYAIAYALGVNEAAMGVQSAIRWVELLDADPLQKVNAMYLRKVVRLQQGDLEGAERCRKQAELLALQASARQMFNTLLALELSVHAAAWDLTGVQQVAARIEPLAERYAGWVPFRHLAQGHYRRLIGDPAAAEQAYKRALDLAAPTSEDPMRAITAWPLAITALTETLIALDRAAEAKALAEAALSECQRREIRAAAYDIVRALGLAEAKLGQYVQATQRLESLIEEQRAAGIAGLMLGLSYEARARAAVWAGDRPAVEHFGKLTAEQYQHGRGSTLGSRYERLMEEARVAGVYALPPLSPFESTIFSALQIDSRGTSSAAVVAALAASRDEGDRKERALRILCEAFGATGGHLFVASDKCLQLAASSAAHPPDQMLRDLLGDFWSEQLDDNEPDTTVMSDHTRAIQIWRDRQGTIFRPLLLSGSKQGELVAAGVVLLEGNPRATFPDAIAVLTEVANALLAVRT
jgi:hypothetical protein